MRYIIEGGKKLTGQISISGNKNAVFPCLAAALLTDEEVTLENVPNIRDVDVLTKILTALGVKVTRRNSTLVIHSENFSQSVLPKELVSQLRGSIVLAGAILGRLGKVRFYHPGGDIIGRRTIETHLQGFKALGAKVATSDLEYRISFGQKSEASSYSIFLSEASVTASENIILATALGKKEIIIKNCPTEPHVLDLCKMLKSMGADIKGIGTDTLKVKGVAKLNGTSFIIGTDYIEVGTYSVAAAITGGEIAMTNIDETDIDPVLIPLARFGINIVKEKGLVKASFGKLKAVPKLQTNIWPGFPTDIMSLAIVLATQSKGVTLCHDWMYESRMFFVDKLISMGANITLADPHRVFVYGATKLKGRELESPDIRAGMALVLAALAARGQSIIHRAQLIERGYEDVVLKLKSLGADIERIE